MKLYGYWRSSASWRVRIALNYKGVPYETVPVHLVAGGGQQNANTFKTLNPMSQVPVLEVTHLGQPVLLAQSMAILEYLEESYPEPPLLPSDRIHRAHVRFLAELVNSGIQPLQNLSVTERIKTELHGDDRAWAQHWISKGLKAMEMVVSNTAGRYCVGDSVTFADVCLIPQMYACRRFGVDSSAFPTLLRIEAECNRLQSFDDARAERQPDAVIQS